MSPASLIIREPKNFFISFKEDTGADCAIHLYHFLKSKGVDVFISSFDIEYDITQGQWREQIDRALGLTKIFIVIITATASTSSEIIREFELVKDNVDVEKYIFIYHTLWNNAQQTTLILPNGDRINLKDYHAQRFGNEHELARKVYDTIPIIQKIEFERLRATFLT